MRKKGKQEVFFLSVMRLYEGAKTRVRVDSELSEEFEVKVGMMLQASMLSPYLCAVALDVVNELTREGVQSELTYADDLVPMSQTIERIGNEVLESKGLKTNLGDQIKLVVHHTQDG